MHQDLHLKDYLNILRRRIDVIVLFFFTTVVVVTIGTFIMRPVYRATTTLLIDLESPNVLTTTGMVELQSQNYFSYKEYYQSQAEILTSYSLARKVFDEFGLAGTPEYSRAKEPIKKFLKTVKVEPVRDTRLLKLSVESRDAELATKIANRMAELYVRRNLYYISKSELLNLIKNEYLKLEAKMSEYAKIYKHKHPEMIKLKQEMAELVDKIEQEKKSIYDYDNIESYLSPDSKHTLAGFKANNVSIQDIAEKPVVPIRPKKLLNIALALIVGLFGGIGLAFFFEYLDDTVKEAEGIEKATEWPFLGNIPMIGSDLRLKEFEKDIFVHIRPKEPISEAYRSVRTSVLFSATEEHPLKAIVITSPGPQEGKTTTLCNLGIAMAQNGQRVLLIDADMRKSRLHGIFKKPNEKGLSGFLCGQVKFDDLIQKIDDIDNLSIVTAGPHPPNPSELLASHRMKEFIGSVKSKYDFVLIDTPPIAMLTDALVLAKATDGAVIVVESGKTSKKVLLRIDQITGDAKARIVGAILNKMVLTRSNYYYYSHYYGRAK